MKEFLIRGYKILVGILVVTLLLNFVVMETSYFTKYENAHQQTIREHERQRDVANLIAIRSTLQMQVESLHVALRREQWRHDSMKATLESERFHTKRFIQKLSEVDKDALRRTLEALMYVPPVEDLEDDSV